MIKLICVNVPEGYEGLLTKGKIYEGEENDMFYFNVSREAYLDLIQNFNIF